MQAGAARGGSFFDKGTYGQRPPRAEPRDPVVVRQHLRKGGFGAFALAVGLVALAVWNIGQQTRRLAGAEGEGLLLLLAGLVGLVGLGLGIWFSLTGWYELPPRSWRSQAPAVVGAAFALLMLAFHGLQQLDVHIIPSEQAAYAIGFGALALHFLAAAWAVLALAWRWRVAAAVAFGVGGLLFVPIGLAWVDALPLPSNVFMVGTIAATCLLAAALIAFGVGLYGTARNATDTQLT